MLGYVPARLVFSGSQPEVEWIATDGSAFDEPFFDETLRRLRRLPENQRGPVRTPTDTLGDTNQSAAPAGFIFHVSRCGSTLVSRMLGSLPGLASVSEPPVLDDILRAHRWSSSVTDADRIAWFRGAVAALCASANATTQRAFVKLDAWHLFELPVVRQAFPDVPFTFVYRNPIEVLVSLMRMPSVAMIRGTLTPEQLRISVEERDALGREELAAAILAAYYRAAHAHRKELAPIAYDELPDAIWRGMFGSTLSDDDVTTLRDVAVRDAKAPGRPFAADADAKRRAATPAESAACARWTNDVYAQWIEGVGRRVDERVV